MTSYGKKEYWDERYTRNSNEIEWIAGYELFDRLLTPNFLCLATAPPPSTGVISTQDLNQWLINHLGPLIRIKNHRSCVIHEGSELEYCPSHESELTVPFPSRDKARVLNVGCGSSSLSADMIYHGWMDIVNIDYSKVIIEKMQERYGDEFFLSLESCIQRDVVLRHTLGLESRDDNPQTERPEPSMTFEHGDITKGINHPDESFDLIICKKTLDVILCSAGSVADARAVMTECFRLLNREHGIMMIVSSGKPEDRATFFERDQWTGVLYIKLPTHHNDAMKSHERKTAEHYVYILYKQNTPSSE